MLLKIFFIFLISQSMVFFMGCKKDSEQNLKILFKKTVISLDLPVEDNGIGGIITTDLNNDNKMDFIVTKPGFIGAWDNSGKKLWLVKAEIQITKKSEANGLPGWHAPGVQSGDIDDDRYPEVFFHTKDSQLCVLAGENGKIKHLIKLKSPKGTVRWEHLVLANFRGRGDHDLLFQTTENNNYRMGRFISAYSFESLLSESPTPLWSRDDFVPNAHSGARVIDLDDDGQDEVIGGTIISHVGKILSKIPLKGHIDSIFITDVRPDIPGLEVVALEEGGQYVPFKGRNKLTHYLNKAYKRLFETEENSIFLYNADGLIWKTHYKHKEPQNAAIGNFNIKNEGLEIWCRSRYNIHQKPFNFDAWGRFISTYKMDNVAPNDWTERGVEVISVIDWTGGEQQLCAAKERHKSGRIVIFEALTGKFLKTFNDKADRLYVADVYGDWREELIVLNGRELHIYQNTDTNSNPNHERLWNSNSYRRSKMTWNYYNP